MMNLDHRSESKEYIDNPQIDAKVLRQTYREMKNINGCTFGYWPTMSAVAYFLARCPRGRAIRILDIGCGDGEVLRRIERYGRKRNYSLDLTGIDLNHEAISTAVALTNSRINYIQGDIFKMGENQTFDLIINSLTTHHLTDQEIIKLLQWMTSRARLGWSIADLDRQAVAYNFIKYFTRMGGFNYVICHDAPLSVARGFRRSDWTNLIAQAEINLGAARIFWYPNFRYGIRYEKPL